MSAQPESARNYLAEAQAIAAGQSMLITETAHLRAVLAQGQAIASNLGTLSRVLAALVVDSGHARVHIPTGLMESVEQRGLSVVIRTVPDGVELLVVPAAPPQARGPRSVN